MAGDLLAAHSLWAVVGANGMLVGGSGATASVKTGGGYYNVTFNRDVAACAVEATPRGGELRVGQEPPVAWAGPVSENPMAVFVGTGHTGGAAVDLPFYLAVHC